MKYSRKWQVAEIEKGEGKEDKNEFSRQRITLVYVGFENKYDLSLINCPIKQV